MAAETDHPTPCIMQTAVHIHVCIAYQLEFPGNLTELNCKNVLNCKIKKKSGLRVTVSFFPPTERKTH